MRMNSLNARRKWLTPSTRRCMSQPNNTPSTMLPTTVIRDSSAVSPRP